MTFNKPKTKTQVHKCCFCTCPLQGDEKHGHNPYPASTTGRCCSQCNNRFVIPVRMVEFMKQLRKRNDEDN